MGRIFSLFVFERDVSVIHSRLLDFFFFLKNNTLLKLNSAYCLRIILISLRDMLEKDRVEENELGGRLCNKQKLVSVEKKKQT